MGKYEAIEKGLKKDHETLLKDRAMLEQRIQSFQNAIPELVGKLNLVIGRIQQIELITNGEYEKSDKESPKEIIEKTVEKKENSKGS